MNGVNEDVLISGDWMSLCPSPGALLSAMLGDNGCVRPKTDSLGENKRDGHFMGTRDNMAPQDTGKKDMTQSDISRRPATECGSSSEPKNIRGGLVDRLAARAGFNAPRLNTENIRSSEITANSEARSTYLTIPPGLSPTTLLESPVFLLNSQVQPSPTTGKFSFLFNSNGRGSTPTAEASDRNKSDFFGDINSLSFSFKPAEPESLFLDSATKTTLGSLPQRSFPGSEISVQSDNSLHSQAREPAKDTLSATGENNAVNTSAADSMVVNPSGGGAENSPPLDGQQNEGEHKGIGDLTGADVAPSEDGYNWRKYGQKQVKGSEFPRSYYKCTHPNCSVKKKVERSHEGHITEIIYKGAHSHSPPPPSRRLAVGSSNALNLQPEFPEQRGQQSGTDADFPWGNIQKGNFSQNSEWRNVNTEVTSSASLVAEFCNTTSSLLPQNGNHTEPSDTIDASSTFSNDGDEEDRTTHGSASLGYDGEGDEPESKRRRVEVYATELTGATRAIREPRVVVQTTSDVDILDDGYRWRKYGQKVVKGNPNPRSYYKCTSPGCNVRKHVERASHDLKSVITTYEGKHNHDVPPARNSSHLSSGAASQMNQAATASSQSHVYRQELPPIHNSMARFDMSSVNSFGLPGRSQLGRSSGFGFGLNQAGLASLPLPHLGSSSGQMPSLGSSSGQMPSFGSSSGQMPALPVHQFLPQCPMNDMGFMLPRGEPKAEPLPEPGPNVSTSSALYQQLMGSLPLGHQM